MNALRSRLAAARSDLAERWLSLSPASRAQARFVLTVCVLVYTVHTLVFTWAQPFYIEDSAISFAYARNLVRGEGLVPFAGAERVEGYSNALWTFLVALFYGLGVHVWISSKVLGWVFGVVALFGSWGLARAARPDAPDHWSAVLAPLLLSFSTQFVLWNASGLENSLFCALLSVGAWRLVREVDTGSATPWSALCFFGLTMTRPDGIAYAAIALFARAAATVAHRQWLALVGWVLAFATPYGLYNAWRHDYFAWWWPNTYYAKSKEFRPFAWTGAGWKMVKDYLSQYGVVYALPLVALGVAGWRGWRKWLVIALSALLALFVLWSGRADFMPANDVTRWIAREWSDARIWYIVGSAVLIGAASFAAPGWLARGFLWASFAAGVFFCVWSNGDWMKGFRWFSLTSVPLFTLLAVGIGELADVLPFAERRWRFVVVRGVVAAAVVIGLAVPAAARSQELVNGPETQVRDVRKRVNYMRWVQSRLGLEDVTLLDVDMGAHMYFTDWYIVDIAGLIDVPVARRKWQKSFGEEYVFYEHRPDFAHQHGSWARTTGLKQRPQWKDEYIEIPGYPSGKRSLHVGNHVRKDHLVGRAYTGPEGRAVPFEGGITLEGWDVPAPEVAPGGELYVDTTWRAGFRASGFRVVVFLSDDQGHLFSAEVAPGYDWYAPESWKPHEYVYGRWSVPLPADLPAGTYDLGFVVLDVATGAVLASSPNGGVEAAPGDPAVAAPPAPEPRYMRGEWRTAGVVRVVSRDEALVAAEADRATSLSRAEQGDCDGARASWRDARHHVARDMRWQESHADALTDAFVRCYVKRAASEPELLGQARVLLQARRLDHRNEALVAVAEPLAERLEQEGDARAAAEDWESAFDAYNAAAKLDRGHPWARRKAEEARDERLGISGKEPEPARRTPPKPSRAAGAPTPATSPP